MSLGPKDVEEKLRKMINRWEQMAATKTFAVTIDEFKAGVKPSFDVRDKIADLDDQLAKAKDDRERVDEASLALAQRVVNAILADGEEGPDSSRLEGFGRKRKSERKSGLTKKKAAKGKSEKLWSLFANLEGQEQSCPFF
ncbi:MAG TPA: hypothetical protein VHP99_13035 [Pyrinomonadaceae bacterium]|nr:hypothetical protein [Pyrinomonadaceae bacterium]